MTKTNPNAKLCQQPGGLFDPMGESRQPSFVASAIPTNGLTRATKELTVDSLHTPLTQSEHETYERRTAANEAEGLPRREANLRALFSAMDDRREKWMPRQTNQPTESEVDHA